MYSPTLQTSFNSPLLYGAIYYLSFLHLCHTTATVHSLNILLLVQVARGKLDLLFFAPPCLLGLNCRPKEKPIPGPRSPPRHEPSCCGGASFHHRPWHCGLRLCQAAFAHGTTASASAKRPSLTFAGRPSPAFAGLLRPLPHMAIMVEAFS